MNWKIPALANCFNKGDIFERGNSKWYPSDFSKGSSTFYMYLKEFYERKEEGKQKRTLYSESFIRKIRKNIQEGARIWGAWHKFS